MKKKKCKIPLPTFTKKDKVNLQLRADFIYDLVASLEKNVVPPLKVKDTWLNEIIEVSQRWNFSPKGCNHGRKNTKHVSR